MIHDALRSLADTVVALPVGQTKYDSTVLVAVIAMVGTTVSSIIAAVVTVKTHNRVNEVHVADQTAMDDQNTALGISATVAAIRELRPVPAVPEVVSPDVKENP